MTAITATIISTCYYYIIIIITIIVISIIITCDSQHSQHSDIKLKHVFNLPFHVVVLLGVT